MFTPGVKKYTRATAATTITSFGKKPDPSKNNVETPYDLNVKLLNIYVHEYRWCVLSGGRGGEVFRPY